MRIGVLERITASKVGVSLQAASAIEMGPPHIPCHPLKSQPTPESYVLSSGEVPGGRT